MDTVASYFWFDTTAGPDVIEKIREQNTESEKGKKIRCRSCEHIITDDSQRISIADSHAHNRTNPNGIDYDFLCFNNAPGCSAFGQATYEYSWFAGHQWQVVVCNGCGEHLGWFFSGESFFYGLITGRLICDEDRSG